jgi:predicted nucleotidyltransferase
MMSMDLARPFSVVTPTVDGDVLQVLASADASFTPPEVHALIGRHSVSGVRKALARLRSVGIVRADRVGQAFSYGLNRDHLAAPHIVAIGNMRAELLERLQNVLEQWDVRCEFASLFGSAASGGMRAASDLDLFVVRPDAVDSDDETWRDQLDHLTRTVTAWTGNDTRILEFSASETAAGLASADEPVLVDIREQGIRLYGPRHYLRPLRTAGG